MNFQQRRPAGRDDRSGFLTGRPEKAGRGDAESPGRTRGGGFVVGAKGFEPSTPCSQSRCATRLRHAPMWNGARACPVEPGNGRPQKRQSPPGMGRALQARNFWGERWDLNPRPPGPQPGALPTELLPPQGNLHTQGPGFWQALFPGAGRGRGLAPRHLHAKRAPPPKPPPATADSGFFLETGLECAIHPCGREGPRTRREAYGQARHRGRRAA